MNTKLTTLLLAMALPLAACQKAPEPQTPPAPASATDTSTPQTALGRTVEKAIAAAREELHNDNLRIDGGVHIRSDEHGTRFSGNLPKAEITRQGDLLIDGKAVAIDAGQRKMLLDYRGHIIGLAEAGMAMGVKGADMAGKAIAETVGGLFAGNGRRIEQRIEVEAKKMEDEAMQLCAQLPAMLVLQQRLAAALPEFKPYATMTQDDVDDCYHNTDEAPISDADRAHIRERIRQGIREGIRETVQTVREEPATADASGKPPASN